MIDIVEAWLKSGKWAEVAGLKLRPVESPTFKGIPVSTVRGQAQAFYLTDDNGLEWILKKFLPARLPDGAYIRAIGALVPHRPGFQSGCRRQIISKKDVSGSGFSAPGFAQWLENTVLMSCIVCDDWLSLAEKIRGGSAALAADERLLLCRLLSENVGFLEANDLSHRDLSVTNVFVDLKNSVVHLIDWDSLFHPSLPMPRNTTWGTEGYIAPFVMSGGAPDARVTWRARADRFGLAVLNAEFLCMEAGTLYTHDGGMFEQAELYGRGGPGTAHILAQLRQTFPAAATLLERALNARGFDDCPSPAEWLAAAGPARAPAPVWGTAGAPSAPSVPQPQAAGGLFAALDEGALVRLDEGALVRLA